uniref:4-vinylphenol methyltransferase 1 n=1 Tax=Locusta migratoria TaxID=7004 RepID=4VMT1_LOCMI
MDKQNGHVNMEKQEVYRSMDKQNGHVNMEKQEMYRSMDKQNGHVNMEKQEAYRSMDKPHLYTLGCSPLTAMAEAQLDALWSQLSWPQTPLPVLDIGCGPGDVARKVLVPRLPAGTRLVACDISPEMLDFCRQHNALLGTITYELLDVVEPRLEDTAVWRLAPFGKVFCLLLLHWVPDNRLAVKNIHKLLVPGGEAVFTVIANMALCAAYEEIAKVPRWTQYTQDVEKFVSPYQHSEDPVGEFSRLLESEGFQVLHCDLSPQKVFFPTAEKRREFLKSVCAFLNRIPEEQKDDFLNDWLQLTEKLKGFSQGVGRNGEPEYYNHIILMTALARKL